MNQLRDDYAERVLRLVERKRKAGKDVVESDVADNEESDDDVIDLMAVIRERLRESSQQVAGHGRRTGKRGGAPAGDKGTRRMKSGHGTRRSVTK